MTSKEAYAEAARMLHEAEMEHTHLERMRALNGIADSWILLGEKLADREYVE